MPLSKDDLKRVQSNLDKLASLRKEDPDATHIHLRRPDGVDVDIPLHTAEQTIKSHPDWKVEDLGTSTTPQNKQNVHVPTEEETAGATGQIASDQTKTAEERAAERKDGPGVPSKPSEEEKKEEDKDTYSTSKKYNVLQDLEHPKGTPHKKGDVLDLTDEEAATFADGLIKKKGFLG